MKAISYFKTNKSDSAFIHTWCNSRCRRQDTLKKERLNGGTSITLNFCVCNLKQLNFRHFNTNSKKFTVTFNFFHEEKKRRQKIQIILFSISGNLGHFPTIPDYFRRFPKATENVRRLETISEETPENFPLYCRRYIYIWTTYFCSDQMRVFHERPSKHLTVFSLERVNIKKFTNLTAKT